MLFWLRSCMAQNRHALDCLNHPPIFIQGFQRVGWGSMLCHLVASLTCLLTVGIELCIFILC